MSDITGSTIPSGALVVPAGIAGAAGTQGPPGNPGPPPQLIQAFDENEATINSQADPNNIYWWTES